MENIKISDSLIQRFIEVAIEEKLLDKMEENFEAILLIAIAKENSMIESLMNTSKGVEVRKIICNSIYNNLI